MKKLKIKVDGVDMMIEVTEQYARGLYIVHNTNAVLNNCKALAIKLDPKTHELQLRQKVTKIGKMGILTIETLDNYLQYFIFESVDKDDFDELLDSFHPKSKAELRMAYDLSQTNL